VDNLTAIVDRNGLQQTGRTEERIRLDPVADKWRAFGWDVQDINGRDMAALVDAVAHAETVTGQPQAIVAHAITGLDPGQKRVIDDQGTGLHFRETPPRLGRDAAQAAFRWRFGHLFRWTT